MSKHRCVLYDPTTHRAVAVYCGCAYDLKNTQHCAALERRQHLYSDTTRVDDWDVLDVNAETQEAALLSGRRTLPDLVARLYRDPRVRLYSGPVFSGRDVIRRKQ